MHCIPLDILLRLSWFLDINTMTELKMTCKRYYNAFEGCIRRRLLDNVIESAHLQHNVRRALTQLSRIEYYVLIRLLDIINNSKGFFVIDIINTTINNETFTVRNSLMYNVKKWTILLYCIIDINKIEDIITSCEIVKNKCDIIIYGDPNCDVDTKDLNKPCVVKDTYIDEEWHLDPAKNSKMVTFTMISYNFRNF